MNSQAKKFDKSVSLILPLCKDYTYPGYNFIYYNVCQNINRTALVIKILALQYRFFMHHRDTSF